MNSRFFLKFTDPPFNLGTLTRRLQHSPLWMRHNLNGNGDSKLTSGVSVEGIDYESLLLNFVKACKTLHISTTKLENNNIDDSITVRKFNYSAEASSLRKALKYEAHNSDNNLKLSSRAVKHEFTETGLLPPLDLLELVLNKNKKLLTWKVMHQYLTKFPLPTTSHAIYLLKNFKCNTWVTSSSQLRLEDSAFLQQNSPPSLLFNQPFTQKPKNKCDYKTFQELCWIALRTAVYRQELDQAFKIVDIATRNLQKDTQLNRMNKGMHTNIKHTHGPDSRENDIPKKKKLTLQISDKPEESHPQSIKVISKGPLSFTKWLTVSPSFQFQLANQYISMGIIFAYPIFASAIIFPSSKIFNKAFISQDNADLFSLIQSIFTVLKELLANCYLPHLPGALIIVAILTFMNSLLLLSSLGSVGSTRLNRYLGIKPIDYDNEVLLGQYIKKTSIFSSSTRIRWTPTDTIHSAFPLIYKQLLFGSPCPGLLSPLKRWKLSKDHCVPTNQEVSKYSMLDNKITELKMVNYITRGYDELVDLNVANYHMFGQQNVSTSYSIDEHTNNPEMFKGYSPLYKHIHKNFAKELRDRKFRIKESLEERAFKEYWTLLSKAGSQSQYPFHIDLFLPFSIFTSSSQSSKNRYPVKSYLEDSYNEATYTWIEPDQDPSNKTLTKLRYKKMTI